MCFLTEWEQDWQGLMVANMYKELQTQKNSKVQTVQGDSSEIITPEEFAAAQSILMK